MKHSHVITTIGAFIITTAIPAIAQAQGQSQQGSAINDAQGLLNDSATSSLGSADTRSPGEIVGNYINTAVGLLGVVSVALLVYAGGLWLTAAGDSGKVETAKKIILSTVIGVIIVGLAYAITTFIITQVAGGVTN